MKIRSSIVVVVAWLFILQSWKVSQASEEKTIGFVLEISGGWLANGMPIKLGEKVLAGSKITHAESSANTLGARILIMQLDNTSLMLSCPQGKPCESRDLPVELGKQSALQQRVIGAVMRIFGQNPERYVPILSRSLDIVRKGKAKDVVMELRDGTISFDPVLAQLSESDGSLRLGFQSLEFNDSSSTTAGAKQVIVNFDPKNEQSAPANGLTAGLYRVLILGPKSSEHQPTGIEFWALLVPQAKYNKASADFSDAEAVVHGWGKDSDDIAKREFLRSYLANLQQVNLR